MDTTQYCNSCRTGVMGGDLVPMQFGGKLRQDGKYISIFSCPACGVIRALTRHENRLTTAHEVTSDEVAAMKSAGQVFGEKAASAAGTLALLGLILAALASRR